MEKFERNHINRNLPTLISLTVVNTFLLAYLREATFLSQEECDILRSLSSSHKQASRLYDILLTRNRGYQALITALVATNQTAASSILLQLKPSFPEAQSYLIQFESKPNGLQEFMESAGDERIMVIHTLDSTVTWTKIKDTTGFKINFVSDIDKISKSLNASRNIVCIKLKQLSTSQDFATYFSCNDLPSDKKIIIITEQEPTEAFRCSQNCVQTSRCKIKISVDEFKWIDLTYEFQQELLQHNVSDQGRIKTFQSFCHKMVYEDSDDFLIRFLNGELLLDLINNKIPVLYRQLVPAVEFYVNRKIKRISRLNSKLFDSDSQFLKKEVFVFSGYEKHELAHFLKRDFISSTKVISNRKKIQFIRLKDDKDFEIICSLNAHLDVNVHWFRQSKYEGNPIHIWIKSRGNIGRVIGFIEECPEPFYEEEFQQKLDKVRDTFATSPFICICDTPGMGKSILLANLARSIRKTHPNRCVLFIVLTEFMELIQELRSKKNVREFDVSILLEALSLIVSSNEFGKQYFKENANQEIEIFYDGLDEVPQEKINVAIMYLKLIPSALKAARIFITARPHLRPLLEEELNTFGYTMEPFDCEDQKKFLTDIWSHTRMVTKQRINEELHLFAEVCISKLKSTLGTKEWDIAGIPLQCLLVAEVFREKGYFYADPENKITNKKCEMEVNIKSITELYQRLFDKKIDKFGHVQLQDKLELTHKTNILKLHGYQSLALIFPSWIDNLKQYLLTSELYKDLKSIC
ncbi:unnamed protein product [Orchesella dallaii]|uniref:CARD domain-containing protein n=1 Tax=Orchesella dallaii TaxID=48710 RepID=A0ABP1RVI1_9HEXA